MPPGMFAPPGPPAIAPGPPMPATWPWAMLPIMVTIFWMVPGKLARPSGSVVRGSLTTRAIRSGGSASNDWASDGEGVGDRLWQVGGHDGPG